MTDNAHMESFFHSLKAEAFHGRTADTEQEVIKFLCSYIPFYNYQRLHSALGYQPPAAYERQAA
jgi:putative transposase